MANPSKQKGTRAETKVVKYLREHGVEAERRALHGNEDLGDILLPEKNIILEVKAGKQTSGYSRQTKEEWLRQTCVEQDNAGASFAWLIICVHGRNVGNYECWSTSGHTFYFLDELPPLLKSF